MTKKTIFFIGTILLLSLTTLADTKKGISPFSPEADSYTTSVQTIFENLPLVTDPTKHKIEGTKKIVEAQTQKKLTGKIHSELFIKFDNCKIIGTININTHGPITVNNKTIYFWIVSGEIQYFVIHYANPPEQRNEKFFYVLHFENDNWKEDCLIIGEKIITLNANIQNAAALVAEPLQKKEIETLYKKSIEKEKWNFNNREVQGKLIGYKNEKALIQQDENKRPFQMDVTKFSLDDQELIRAYIDHLNIPVRDIQDKKQKSR
ncbi:MAG: hypothetical protein LBC20_07735 [Planctomycetaceae bacterium]|jgi:hypothetical protein|nr:hypothetical protein [Planctomycetaceae bacterium]